jgi:hypothetical protein
LWIEFADFAKKRSELYPTDDILPETNLTTRDQEVIFAEINNFSLRICRFCKKEFEKI